MILDHFIQLKPFSGNPDEYAQLAELTRKENHSMIQPTNTIWKNGQIVGCFGVSVVPIVSTFFSTQHMQARDSVQAINTMEQILFHTGAKGIFVPLNINAPFYPLLEKMGYTKDDNLRCFCKYLCVT